MKIVIGILVLIALSGLLFVLYILNKRTPLPEGCEDLYIDDEKCKGCSNEACAIKRRINDKEGETV